MFRPNMIAMISTPTGPNLFGESEYGTPEKALCGVVRLVNKRDKTTVRADSSASRGNSDERTFDAKILFSPNREIFIGDKVQISGFTLRVMNCHPRYAVNTTGNVDHYEVDLETWF